MDAQSIDVKRTFEGVSGKPSVVSCVLKAMREEEQGKPLEIPPGEEEDFGFALLRWQAEGNLEVIHNFHTQEEFPPESLLLFVKKPEEEQQKILLRAFYLNMKYFYGKNFKLFFKD